MKRLCHLPRQTEGEGDQHFSRPKLAVMGAAARMPSWVPRWAQTLLSAGFKHRERQHGCPQRRQLNGLPVLVKDPSTLPSCYRRDSWCQIPPPPAAGAWRGSPRSSSPSGSAAGKSNNQCRGEEIVLSLQNIRICKEPIFF